MSCYIRCDKCGARIAPAVEHLSRSDTETELRKTAIAAGWTGPMTPDSNDDRCPNCTVASSGFGELDETPRTLDWE